MDITGVIAVLGTISLSVERIVEVIKSLIPFLAKEQEDDTRERIRRITHHILAAVVGFIIAILAQDLIQPLLSDIFKTEGSIGLKGCLLIGLLSSGGSGFWNSSLRLVEEFKKSRKLIAIELKKKTTLSRGISSHTQTIP